MSGPFTSSSWKIQSFSLLFSCAGWGWFSGWFGRKWSKSGTFVLKLSMQPRSEEGKEENESNERWQRIQIEKRSKGAEREKQRLLLGVVKGKLGMSDWETRIERARGRQRSVEGREKRRAGTFQLQHTETTKTQISRDYNSRQPGGRSSFSLLHFSYPFSTQITSWNI